MSAPCPAPAPESDEPLDVYIANALALPPRWQDALLRLTIEGALSRLGTGRYYGRPGDPPGDLVDGAVARALERHDLVRFAGMGNQHVPTRGLYLTDRGRHYGKALAAAAPPWARAGTTTNRGKKGSTEDVHRTG